MQRPNDHNYTSNVERCQDSEGGVRSPDPQGEAVGRGHEDGHASGSAGPAVPCGSEGEGTESTAAGEAQQNELGGDEQASAAAEDDQGQQMLLYYLTVPFLSVADAEYAHRTLIQNAHLLRRAVHIEVGVLGQYLTIQLLAENYEHLYISIASVIFQLSILMEAVQFPAALALQKPPQEKRG